MPRKHIPAAVALVLSAAAAAAALVAPAPARADSTTDAFLAAVSNAGVGLPDQANAVTLGQSVCPMLSQPGQTTADVANAVASASGLSLGPATMFTGLAISIFCPAVLSSVDTGSSPIGTGSSPIGTGSSPVGTGSSPIPGNLLSLAGL